MQQSETNTKNECFSAINAFKVSFVAGCFASWWFYVTDHNKKITIDVNLTVSDLMRPLSALYNPNYEFINRITTYPLAYLAQLPISLGALKLVEGFENRAYDDTSNTGALLSFSTAKFGALLPAATMLVNCCPPLLSVLLGVYGLKNIAKRKHNKASLSEGIAELSLAAFTFFFGSTICSDGFSQVLGLSAVITISGLALAAILSCVGGSKSNEHARNTEIDSHIAKILNTPNDFKNTVKNVATTTAQACNNPAKKDKIQCLMKMQHNLHESLVQNDMLNILDTKAKEVSAALASIYVFRSINHRETLLEIDNLAKTYTNGRSINTLTDQEINHLQECVTKKTNPSITGVGEDQMEFIMKQVSLSNAAFAKVEAEAQRAR